MTRAERAGETFPAPSAESLDSVRELCDRGQLLSALRRAESLAALRDWRGAVPCALAARIASGVGAPALAVRLAARAWRADPCDPVAIAQYGYEILVRRGPVALWQRLREWRPSWGEREEVGEVLALQAHAAGMLRDFASAESLLARAEALEPDRAWIRLQRWWLLEYQDRPEQALEAAVAACALHPHAHYRSGVQARAHLLQLLDRDEEAIALLEAADAELESSGLAVQLYGLLSENGRWAQAEAALERHRERAPLLEPRGQRWLDAQRARVAYHRGERARAASFAALLDDPFHRGFAARLAEPATVAERIQLDVSFVRQHFKTCAPATFAALGRYWEMPADHLKLAEAICYDGTPQWQQREWAEANGWLVRGFRLTHESALALLERQIPFALTLVDASSAHMVAGIGFDRVRGSLLLRDPAQPYVLEVSAAEFLESHRAFGPRATVFVPRARADALDGVELPDAALYDAHDRQSAALARHDRAVAAQALAALESADADATLTWEGRLALAVYDANDAERARCMDRLLERFPDHPARLLQRYGCMEGASREAQISFLRSACTASGGHPALLVALARALSGDARCAGEMRRLVRRALRLRPTDCTVLVALADSLWEAGRRDEATESYRFAADVEGFAERLYQAWFLACRQTRRTDEALAHLRDRFARFGQRSAQPALTLAWAWLEMEQPSAAREVLEQAMRLRPEDGPVRLRAASLLSSMNEPAEAEGLLDATRGKVHERDWLRARLELAEHRLDFAAVLEVGRELLSSEPLALEVQRAVLRALIRREGMEAARAELDRACARFPHHCGLHRLLVEASRDASPQIAEAAARRLLRLEPSDAWGRRELAGALLREQRAAEALSEAQEAVRVQPESSAGASMLGLVHRELGELAAARAELRRAVILSVDNTGALGALLDLAHSDAARRDELAWIERELVRQVVQGDGLLVFVEIARPLLDPASLLAMLRQAHAERPDLWHAWSALVSQLAHLGQLDEALALAHQACERFAHLPRTWLDLAEVQRWRGAADEEIAAAARAFEIQPGWSRSALALGEALMRSERMDEAQRVHERALRHSPRDAQMHAAQAELLWRQRRPAEALAAIERALRLAPAANDAWGLLTGWAAQSGEPGRPGAFARTLAAERPGEVDVWLTLARVLGGSDTLEERLAAVERALALDRGCTEAWDLEAQLLVIGERFADAIRACEEGAAVCRDSTHVLRGRIAAIQAEAGRLDEAIASMRAVLDENASYVWGWHRLAEWLQQQGDLEGAAQALERLQRLLPREAWVRRQLGQLRLQREEQAAARESFAAALALQPADVLAAHRLLDLQLASEDLQGARATLQRMQAHQPGAATQTAEIRVRLHGGERAEAQELLHALARSPDPDPWPLDAAAELFARADLDRMALRVLRRALREPPYNGQVATAAIALLLRRRAWTAALRLFLRLPPGEAQRRAAAPLVEALVSGGCRWRLRWLLARRSAVLERDDAAWGQVGRGLAAFRQFARCASWLASWKERPDVQPWILFNYCLALRNRGRWREASEVARHAITAWGHRDGARALHLFAAIEDALAGELVSAQAHLEQVTTRRGVAYEHQLLSLTRLLVELQRAPREQRRRRFRELRRQLDPRLVGRPLMSAMRDVRRTFARTRWVCTREGAGPGAWLWFSWQLHWRWFIVPTILAVRMILELLRP